MRGSVVIQTDRDEVVGIVDSPGIQLGPECRSPCYQLRSTLYASLYNTHYSIYEHRILI
jgi:hypothetical protein